ncbi:class III poly(R)-hydroxyalkanoic acid synthase subunit PhaE [Thermomonas sp.]|uniref:class III poly(R)-hydroxyalkanoic acid synthase subunit PhaE n=1 Tax=Thermomonas sp. TaxID=1971895 RepID=UPI00391C26EF
MADASNDFAALARQYMSLWGDAMRGIAAPPPADPGLQGMRDMLEAWMRQAGGTEAFGPALAHFNRQCGDWYAQMQQVAARFAGRDHSAADVAAAWQEAFAGSHPFAGLVDGMRGPGLEGIAQWMDAANASLQGLRADAAAALRMPAFGFTREHQERLQALALAQLRWQDAQQAYGKLMDAVSRDAMARFEAKLAEHEEPGRQIGSVRALFDLWVDAAEEAWAQMALSPEYRHAFGELVNAQMRLRAAAQAVGEQAAATFGWPARSELDGAYRRLAEVERQLRRLQRRENAPAPRSPAPAPRTSVVKKKAAAKPATASKVTKSATRVASTRTAKAAPVKPAPAKSTRTTRKIAKTPARKR